MKAIVRSQPSFNERTMTYLSLTAIVTLLVVLLMFATAVNAGRAKRRDPVRAPGSSPD
jgi:hypothetical protein